MSHFSVLVIGEDVEGQLAPFQENNMGDCPEQYLEFVDKEDEIRHQFENESTERIVMPDGSLKTPWDETFRVTDTPVFGSSGTHEVPAHLERRDVPFKELYSSLEEFAEGYCGMKARDPETGRYGYRENPNAKWDWYMVGGRWANFFKLKPKTKSGPEPELKLELVAVATSESEATEAVESTKGEQPTPPAPANVEALLGLLMDTPPEPGYADSCLVGDIDIDGMRASAVARAAESYDTFHAVLAGRPYPKFDEVLAEHNGDVDAARAAMRSNPVIKDLNKARSVVWIDREQYLVSRDEYLERARNSALATFAVLKDGTWYERGAMGWFGVASDEKDIADWTQQCAALFDSLPADTRVTLVDCHI